MTRSMKKSDRKDFELYCRQCTDNQLINVRNKERDADRRGYERIAAREMKRRGM